MSGLAFAAFGISLLEEQQRQKAGKAEESQLRKEGRELALEARDRELNRRRDLNKILSSQAAQFAGSGIDLSTGSAQAIMRSSAAEAQRDFETENAMVVKRQKEIAEEIRQRRKARRQGAFTRVVGSALKAYQAGGS
jgi:hypothetical protein